MYLTTKVYAQQLSPDGSTLTGDLISVLENDQPWEAHVIEGMWMIKYSEHYYMFYSGNDFSTPDYGIGVAVADHPLGPFRKSPRPFLFTTAEWSAPGHASVVQDCDGKLIMFLHGYRPGTAGYKGFRALLGVVVELAAELSAIKAHHVPSEPIASGLE
jgi:arabinan endo-1,5-alpha-L-arabinosidase